MSTTTRHPRTFRLALECAADSRNAGERNAARCALILLNLLGAGRRSRAWTHDFARLCSLAGVA